MQAHQHPDGLVDGGMGGDGLAELDDFLFQPGLVLVPARHGGVLLPVVGARRHASAWAVSMRIAPFGEQLAAASEHTARALRAEACVTAVRPVLAECGALFTTSSRGQSRCGAS